MGWCLERVKPVLVAAALPKLPFVLRAMQTPELVAQVTNELAQPVTLRAECRQVLQNLPAQAKPVPRWTRPQATLELAASRLGLPRPASFALAQQLSIPSPDQSECEQRP